MQRALADPRPPAVLVPGGGSLRIGIRIPMDTAAFFYTLVPAPGTPVYIRG